ncbi:hypothetical protein MLD38_028019 [Melastoma candidum]|uniref:Uncharacterized protein n=1 Tax=Melastoma candidum TaxID=119954 RepID=A0ACB9N135_9MYRT|nr:hypothetical protein MLD38_028019 [Melastoma candidum]
MAPPHLLVCPFPSSGHLIPILDLTDRLLRRGVTITVVVAPRQRPFLDRLHSTYPSSAFRSLVFPIPPISFPASPSGLVVLIQAIRDSHGPAIASWFESEPGSSRPVAIISDFFMGWTLDLARLLGIPRIVFSPSGAFALSVELSLFTKRPKNPSPEDDEAIVRFDDLPGKPSYPWCQLHKIFREYTAGNTELAFHCDGIAADRDSWGMVVNTFAELENPYIDHMKNKIYGLDRVWAVGPLLPPEDDSEELASRGGSSSVPPQQVLGWLDNQKQNSVVYVCFGSRLFLSNEQRAAAGTALEQSGVNFIWCDRHPEGKGPDILLGFEDRVAGRGLVIRGWAPQVMILRHPAVGAFLTHCGWNSVLEGISSGVVMLTWPMGSDQFTDAKLLVDELGVGIRACEGETAVPDPDLLSQVLAESVKEGRPERGRAEKLKEAAAAAVGDGGSSFRDLDDFVRKLSELQNVA